MRTGDGVYRCSGLQSGLGDTDKYGLVMNPGERVVLLPETVGGEGKGERLVTRRLCGA